ncbi:MBL fold metallo-hydrolase [Alkalicoccobacillus plakortidis]|uniref:MBL fold metallo-hydrolase n=1 Tax=Alkalicoccobacillus plakortidis TaxID=444060 RepID=UPI00358DB8D2
MRKLGRPLSDLRHIIFTHSHFDHVGSAAAIIKATGAKTYMHEADAKIAEEGGGFRTMRAAPGLLQRVLFRIFWHPNKRFESFHIDQTLKDGDVLELVGGFKVVHVPGHSAGHIVLLWKEDKVMFAGDIGTNLLSIGDPIGFENEKIGRESQRKLGKMDYEAIVFGHGRPITSNASEKIRRVWP